MSMHPIISALKHHKTPVALILVQIALTCAIIMNSTFLIQQLAASIIVQPGVSAADVVWAKSSGSVDKDAPPVDANIDVQALRSVPGVKHVAMASALPLSNSGSYKMKLKPVDVTDNPVSVAVYLTTKGFLAASGLELTGGRDFVDADFLKYSYFASTPPPRAVIVSEALAHRLWPGRNAIGNWVEFQKDGHPSAQVVGVVKHMLAPALHGGEGDAYTLIFPVTDLAAGLYVMRTEEANRDRLLRDAQDALYRVNKDRVITAIQHYADTVDAYFRGDRAMIWMLSALTFCLLVLVCIGVIALSNYWVNQRQRSIGIRRALGARRGDIVRHFQWENLLIVSVGVLIGACCATALNGALMKWFELPRLPFAWLPLGGLLLLSLGQIAVLGPALRASWVPPGLLAKVE